MSQSFPPARSLDQRLIPGALGLTAVEARRRLERDGANEIRRQAQTSRLLLFADQFKSSVVALLIAACAISAVLGEVADALAIGTIVVINALVGFFQEYRAERSVLALRSMTAPRARVFRDGQSSVIAASEVVCGDVMVLEAGDVVAADARLVEANQLSTNEAPLTGESAAVQKSALVAPEGAPLAERSDSVFMGTSVASGTALAEVRAIGMHTELGRIAHLLASVERSSTPLQERLARVSRLLIALCIGIVAVVAAIALVRGTTLFDVFMLAVSLAVAAVPEGLPAIVTIALAIGVERMAARHVLVRKLPAVETLGCATVICTDKTGTLTRGIMTVRELWGPDHSCLLDAAAACCDAELADAGGGVGDPTELALLSAARERGIERSRIESARPRVSVLPFDSERKRMAITRADGVLYVKGAVEMVLPLCATETEAAAAANTEMAARGLRVLAVAIGKGEREAELELLGLVGIADPPRTEAIEAVRAAQRAGIQTVMITGDHAATAQAIARELGILRPGESPDELVHARATPDEKLSIVRRWKARGAIVAMTGDGVNDAPALREAHIGIAMGKTGTEVTREASDMVLADDNFASIVAAIREGRGIFDNIRKTLVYLLTGGAAELSLMLAAAVIGLPAPLLPLQLLWINLVTQGLPALALVMDPTSADVLDRRPRDPNEPMLGGRQWAAIGAAGLVEAALTLGVFIWGLQHRDAAVARSFAFSVFVFSELFRAFAARSPTHIYWQVGAFTNMRLVAVVIFSVLVQLGVQQIPGIRALLEIGELSAGDTLVAIGLGLIPVTAIELFKIGRGLCAPSRPPTCPSVVAL